MIFQIGFIHLLKLPWGLNMETKNNEQKFSIMLDISLWIIMKQNVRLEYLRDWTACNDETPLLNWTILKKWDKSG